MSDQNFEGLEKLSPEVRARLVSDAEEQVRQLNANQARFIQQAKEAEASAEIARQIQKIGNPSQYQRQNIISAVHAKYQVWGHSKVGK